MMELLALVQECAPAVEQETLAALVKVESGFNPYAIGIVNGRLVRQPKNKEEAIATAQALEAAGWNYSLGLLQINKHNLPTYNLTISEAFNPCANLRVGAQILNECHNRAKKETKDKRQALSMAFSCYYSGNFKTGFDRPITGGPSYVEKVAANLGGESLAIQVTPLEKEYNQIKHSINSPVLLELDKTNPGEEKNEASKSKEANTENQVLVF